MKKQLEIQSLFELSSVAAPAIHPDGSKVVYVKTDILKDENTYGSQLFTYDCATQTTTQWTESTGQNFAPTWSPDGKYLSFISTRTGKAQLYLLSANGGEATKVTDLEQGISNPIWSPLSDKIFFTAAVKDKGKENTPNKLFETNDGVISSLKVDKMVYRGDTIGFFDTNAHKQIFVFEVADKNITQLTEAPVNHNLSDIAADGNKLLYSRVRNITNEKEFDGGIYELDLPTKTEKEITATIKTGRFETAKYAPSGQRIAFIGTDFQPKSANVNALFYYDETTQTITNILGAADIYIGDCGTADFKQKTTTDPYQWLNDENLLVTTSHIGKVMVYHVNIDGTHTPLFTGFEHIFDFSLGANKEVIAFASSEPTVPNNIHLYNLSTKERTQISAFNDTLLAEYNLGEYIEVQYETTDGYSIHGYLVQPSDFDASKKYPLIYDIHGGPHAMHAATFFHEAQVMVAKGYAVLLLNPRGSHGYGQRHTNGVLGAYGEGDYTDLMQGLDGVINDYAWIDADRLYVTGGSYGGYMTNWMVTQTNRFRSAVTQRSISNWVSFIGVSDIGYYFYEWEMNADIFNLEKMWKHSPLAYVRNVETPLLILHSEEDYRCPIEQGEQFYTYLKYLDKTTEFRRFPKSSHELSRSGIPSLRIERLEAIFDWFNRYE